MCRFVRIAITPKASAIMANVLVSSARNQRSATIPIAVAASNGARGAITNLTGREVFPCDGDRNAELRAGSLRAGRGMRLALRRVSTTRVDPRVGPLADDSRHRVPVRRLHSHRPSRVDE